MLLMMTEYSQYNQACVWLLHPLMDFAWEDEDEIDEEDETTGVLPPRPSQQVGLKHYETLKVDLVL